MRSENTYYFIRKEYDFKEDEKEIQRKLKERENQSNLLREKITNMNLMEKAMENFNPEDYNIPRLMIRLKKSVYPGLANLSDDLITKGNVCNTMLECEIDEKYMETYISYVKVNLQKHTIEKVGNRKPPGNRSRTFKDKKRVIQKGAVKKAIDEGKPSVDVQKIESDIMKIQSEVDIARIF
jgi:hypothetical protein